MVFFLRTVARLEVVLNPCTAEGYEEGGEVTDLAMASLNRGSCGIWKGGRYANIGPVFGIEC